MKKNHQLFHKHVLKLPLYYINKIYLRKFESIMNLLNNVWFLHPMNILKGLQLIFNVFHWLN
jgi:hypothetical protein